MSAAVIAFALTTGEAIILIAVLAVPLAVLAFVLGARGALGQVGKGQFAIEQEPRPRPGRQAPISAAAREAEVRQMLEAKAYRQRARGEEALDVEAELGRLLDDSQEGDSLRADAQLVAEVRQLAIARNERRQRQGKEPLDIEAEVERRLRELEDLAE